MLLAEVNIPEVTRRHMRMMFVAPLRKALLEQVGYGLAVEGISATDLKNCRRRKSQVRLALTIMRMLDQSFGKGSNNT
jgi:hypothetical protein